MNKEMRGEDLVVLKRLRIGKVKEVNSLRDELETYEEQEEMQGKEEWVMTCGVKEENRREKEMEVVGNNGGKGVPVLESTPSGENETQIVDTAAKKVAEEEVGTELSNKELESTLGGENETEIVNAAAKGVVDEEDGIELSNKELEVCGADEIAEVMETTEQSDAEGTQLEIGNNGEIQQKGGNMLEIPQMGSKMEL